jgi:aminoglycoside phosphotransferase (APT) family kinase protein
LNVNSYVPPPSLNIYRPLESTALKALSLLEDSSQRDVDDRLLQLPEILEQGEPLLAKKVVALGDDVVIKFGKTIDPTELHIMQYLTMNCPAVRCPKPLGFVVLGKVRYLFMTRVQGSTLHSLWPSLMVQQRDGVRNSLEEMLSAMRSLVWTPGTPLGTLSEPHICQDARTYVRTGGPFYNEAEFNSFLLRDPLPRISSSYLRWMQSCLRDDHKIVMTHGDLNPHNIILQKEDDGSVSVSGLIDWALGGWYPEYWDAVKALNIRGTDDESDWWCSLPWTLNQFTAEVAINRLLESCTR